MMIVMMMKYVNLIVLQHQKKGNVRKGDPRARTYPEGTHDNVKKAMGHIQGVGSGRYIGQYSPCREASNARKHGCPSDLDTTFWGS